MPPALALALALAVALAAPATTPSSASAVQITPADAVAGQVDVAEVQRDAAEVRGTLVNRTPDTVRNVELLVSDTFHWTNERHPGEDDPGGATATTIAGPVPPGGSLPFRVAVPALPSRRDGSWATTVRVVGFERQAVR